MHSRSYDTKRMVHCQHQQSRWLSPMTAEVLNTFLWMKRVSQLIKMLWSLGGKSLTCFSSAFICCKPDTVTALNPLIDEYWGRGPVSLWKTLTSVWVQPAFRHVTVACTSPRLKHVTAAWAPKDCPDTVTAGRKDGFSTLQEAHKVYWSVGVQCLRRSCDGTFRRFSWTERSEPDDWRLGSAYSPLF